MSDQSKTCYPPNSEDLPNAISSPASESGATPCAKPDGPTTDQSGPAVAPANLSARQAKEAGLLTSGTYGPRSFTSYSPVILISSLASKLAAKTDLLGSTLFRLTWKQRVTPLGLRICALRASVLRTSGSGCTSWPSPSTALGGKNERTLEGAQKEAERRGWNNDLCVAALASWPTPNTPSGGPNVTSSAKHTGGDGFGGRRDSSIVGSGGLVNGAWANHRWIPCRDGKYRPIEPGSSPLATGITNRVGKLRGYGNALCAPVAQGFIEAYLETEKE